MQNSDTDSARTVIQTLIAAILPNRNNRNIGSHSKCTMEKYFKKTVGSLLKRDAGFVPFVHASCSL